MSRLMADQESRGDNGESCSGEEDSVMRVNLAEGCEAVNDDERRGLFGLLVYLVEELIYPGLEAEQTR